MEPSPRRSANRLVTEYRSPYPRQESPGRGDSECLRLRYKRGDDTDPEESHYLREDEGKRDNSTGIRTNSSNRDAPRSEGLRNKIARVKQKVERETVPPTVAYRNITKTLQLTPSRFLVLPLRGRRHTG